MINEKKVKIDPFYGELHSLINVEDAGYFDDALPLGETVDYGLNILCTPLVTLRHNLLKDQTKKPCILLNTGSFCPVHEGHLEMMTSAKDYIESLGYNVVQAYVSPGHDEYILAKNKDQAIPVHHRIKLINDAIKEQSLSSWLSVDPWEGVFNKVAINFTQVIYRLEEYVRLHLGTPIPVFFVCGGDNARFAYSFVMRGQCIVVGRPGYDSSFEHYSKKLKWFEWIHFVPGTNDMSSTSVRKESQPYKHKKKSLKLRSLGKDFEGDKLLTILERQFKSIKINRLCTQYKKYKSLKKKVGSEILSLDEFIAGDHNLQISRLYDNFGLNRIGYTNRPGSLTLNEQLAHNFDCLVPKDLTVFDDDIHTGGTMKFVFKLFSDQDFSVKDWSKISFQMSKADEEVLDAHDFQLWLGIGGLVTELPNGVQTRVPYIYPFVDPYVRCSVGQPLVFSLQIWMMNAIQFHGSGFVLKDYSQYQVFYYMGFDDKALMYDICMYFVKYLFQFVNDK